MGDGGNSGGGGALGGGGGALGGGGGGERAVVWVLMGYRTAHSVWPRQGLCPFYTVCGSASSVPGTRMVCRQKNVLTTGG